MTIIDQIDKSRVPEHVAIIMDGNGRWAKRQGKERTAGHEAGVTALHRTIEAAKNIGIKYLTAYTFSTENWNRPQKEVDMLMNLIAIAIDNETPGMIANGVHLELMGDLSRMPEFAYKKLMDCKAATADCHEITLIIALNYGSRDEICRAVRSLAQQVADGKLKAEEISEAMISNHLDSAGIPDPSLLIRTGGELRISNYLMWQIAYSELYFCDTYWPDFGEEDLAKAVIDFQSRERRFGKTSEQVESEK